MFTGPYDSAFKLLTAIRASFSTTLLAALAVLIFGAVPGATAELSTSSSPCAARNTPSERFQHWQAASTVWCIKKVLSILQSGDKVVGVGVLIRTLP